MRPEHLCSRDSHTISSIQLHQNPKIVRKHSTSPLKVSATLLLPVSLSYITVCGRVERNALDCSPSPLLRRLAALRVCMALEARVRSWRAFRACTSLLQAGLAGPAGPACPTWYLTLLAF